MHQFVNCSPWDHEAAMTELRRELRGRALKGPSSLILSEFHFQKYGHEAVGTSRHVRDWPGMYRGIKQPGARSFRGQLAIGWTWTDGSERRPIAARLYMPPEWANDAARLSKASVPRGAQKIQDRAQTAFDVLTDAARDMPFDALLLDKYYGDSLEFLTKLERRGLPYIIRPPQSGWARFYPTCVYPLPSRTCPRRLGWWGGGSRYHDWRESLNQTPRRSWFPLGQVDSVGDPMFLLARRLETIPLVKNCRTYRRHRWLIFVKNSWWSPYWERYISNLPEETPIARFADLLSHFPPRGLVNHNSFLPPGAESFEGRSWRGFHHHLTLCMLAGQLLAVARRIDACSTIANKRSDPVLSLIR